MPYIGDLTPLKIILVDSNDHLAEKTGVVSPTVEYCGPTMQSFTAVIDPDWVELGDGLYLLTPTTAMMATKGELLVKVSAPECETFYKLVEITLPSLTTEDIDEILHNALSTVYSVLERLPEEPAAVGSPMNIDSAY